MDRDGRSTQLEEEGDVVDADNFKAEGSAVGVAEEAAEDKAK